MSDPAISISYMTLAVGALTCIAGYYLLKSMFGDSDRGNNKNTEEEAQRPRFERLPIGKISKEEISNYTGKNDTRILISICGRLFDMGAGRDFYGPGGPYSCFVGGDASFMLGSMSLNVDDKNKTDFQVDGDIQMTLSDWIAKFRSKYPIVGRLEGFDDLCPESWREAGIEDLNVNENESIINGNKEITKMTLTELNGSGNDYISVGGFIFNVSGAEFVYAPFYGDFPGSIRHDISLAIALNQFNNDNYNKPISSIAQNKDAMERLQKMFIAFRDTYPIVGKISDEGFEINEDMADWDIVQKQENENNVTEDVTSK